MTDDAEDRTHRSPGGASTKAAWGDVEYTATSDWLVLRKNDTPLAEVFSTAYIADDGGPDRPVTFVFNGGPGVSSAFLHVGVLGPQRVEFPPDGSLPVMPPRLVHNDESWLAFTDLVLIDPVGTGFSRMIAAGLEATADTATNGSADPNEYFTMTRDLDSMCEFISRWLSEHGRWGAPIFLAGESYGGYRVGRMVRRLQEKTGVGLNGAILISPAFEPAYLGIGHGWGDYDITPWVDLVPSMALTAAFHGRSRIFEAGDRTEVILRGAEEFATGEYTTFLARGTSMPPGERDRILTQYANLTGLDVDFVRRAEGRVRVLQFIRELLRDEGTVVGAYDSTVTAKDPFPDRDGYSGADPTLIGLGSVFTPAVNAQIRSEIGLETDREYRLVNMDVNLAWKNDESFHYIQHIQGATDDFRFGMASNPHVRAFITHGRYDLVTPYYTTDRLRNLMRLDEDAAARLTVQHFDGGHMFYAWDQSRKDFTAAISEFYANALPTQKKGNTHERITQP